jgi:hypothetical protein
MKNEKFLSAILEKELTPESKNKLSSLNELLKNQPSNEALSSLQAAISENEIIRFIFEYAGKSQAGGKDTLLKDYLSTEQVMEALNISRRTLAVWRASGILEGEKFRNKYLYSIRKIGLLLTKNYKANKTGCSQAADT